LTYQTAGRYPGDHLTCCDIYSQLFRMLSPPMQGKMQSSPYDYPATLRKYHCWSLTDCSHSCSSSLCHYLIAVAVVVVAVVTWSRLSGSGSGGRCDIMLSCVAWCDGGCVVVIVELLRSWWLYHCCCCHHYGCPHVPSLWSLWLCGANANVEELNLDEVLFRQ
jgi:hypothetical protein